MDNLATTSKIDADRSQYETAVGHVRNTLVALTVAGIPKFTPEQHRIVLALAQLHAQTGLPDVVDSPVFDALALVTDGPDPASVLAAVEASERGATFVYPAGMIDPRSNPHAASLDELDQAIERLNRVALDWGSAYVAEVTSS